MSFLRPGARRALARWGETAIYALVTAAALWWIVADSALAGPWRWGIAGFVLIAGLLLSRSAALSALGRREASAPGVVNVDERRVAYLGPHQGGFVSLDELQAIEIWSADDAHFRHEAEWVLRGPAGESALIVPVSALGAERLIDAFAALPGFAPARAFAALAAPPGVTVTIWRRGAGPVRPALAGGAAAD